MDNLFTIFDLMSEINPDVPADSILSRTLLNTEHLRVILFDFAPGQELSEHTASMPAVLHFLRGTAQLTVGETEQQAQPGTWVHMAANVPHSIVAETAVSMLLVMVKNHA